MSGLSCWSPIVELRQYVLHPGGREVLIDLFDSTFIEPQEVLGMKVIGQFRDLDHPDRFVWLRGFEDMDERARGLADFYDGPVWRDHRDAANATMIDSENVLLLRPARPDSAFGLDPALRPGEPGGERAGVVEATILHVGAPAEEAGAVSLFEEAIAPAIGESDGSILGYFVTEPSENTFPRLPVREGEQVFVWCAGFADRPTFERAARGAGELRRTARRSLGLERPPQVLRLEPTSRSLLDGRSPACGAVLARTA